MSIPRPRQKGRKAETFRFPAFHSRLRLIIGAEQPYAWAKRMGISKGAFTRIWKQGTIPTAELLLRIRQATGVSLDWLLAGAGDRGTIGKPGSEMVPVPVLTVVAGADKVEDCILALRRNWIESELGADPKSLAMVWVRGGAMSPTLVDGDMAVISRRQRSITEDGLYALSQGGTLRILRVQRLPGGKFRASSDNSRFTPFVFSAKGDVTVAGRVVCIGRMTKGAWR